MKYTLMLLGVLICSPVTAAEENMKPGRSSGFRPFSITSTKLGKEMASDFIESKIMCKRTWDELEANMDLIQNYDVLSSLADHSMSMTEFAGVQEGKAVRITVMVTRPDQIVRHIYIAGDRVLSCDN